MFDVCKHFLYSPFASTMNPVRSPGKMSVLLRKRQDDTVAWCENPENGDELVLSLATNIDSGHSAKKG